uniref:Uncharacterized protein n=1 Tax=Cucumis melo TaxID=3656 RepID=A0A9I9ELB3_CUCME
MPVESETLVAQEYESRPLGEIKKEEEQPIYGVVCFDPRVNI